MSQLTPARHRTGHAISTCGMLLLCLAIVLACDHQEVPAAAPPPTQTLTPTAAPSPTSTLDPAVRVDRARQALHDGDYETSIILFREALGTSENDMAPDLIAPLSRAYFLAGRHDELVRWLNTSRHLDELSDDGQALVLGLLARSYDALAEWGEAIHTYERYLELDDTAAHKVRQRIAQIYESLGQPGKALEQLEAIDISELDTSARAAILDHQAGLLAQLEDSDRVLVCLNEILTFAQDDYYRASIAHRKGQVLLQMGRRDEATAVLQEVLEEYPKTWGAYLALLALDEIDAAEITDLHRGQLLYHARQYEESIRTLDTYRLSNPYGHWSTAHYYTGLAYQRLGEYHRAAEEFDIVISRFARSVVAGDAWMAKAGSVQATADDPTGIYSAFVEQYPDHARAPEALWRAAEWLESHRDWKAAGAFYQELRLSYPNDPGADEAFFREGLVAYASGDYTGALSVWEQRPQGESPTSTVSDGAPDEGQAQWLTWTGLSKARLGDDDAAHSCWVRAARVAPDSYYGLRARDLIRDDRLALPRDTHVDVPETPVSNDDWQQIKRWISTWSQTDHEALPPLEEPLLVRRGRALWWLGWHAESMDAYRLYADGIRAEPHAILALAVHCHASDIHAMTIWCAERLLGLGDQAGAGDPPHSLLRLAYPTTYGHLVQEQAALYDLDPLLFLALIRQESRFDAYVSSWAGAVGLAQIMPETGIWIAERLGTESYRDDLLLRPSVSVRFGTLYLSWALDLFDRYWPAALAAYNAGPTRVSEWTAGELVSDPDLFYEMIPLPETKAFVKLVYENYRMYQRLGTQP